MVGIQISQGAIQDIAHLAQGTDRVEVALGALKESTLTVVQVAQLRHLLESVSPTENPDSATQSKVGGRINTVDGHQAVEGQISVNGQPLDTLLSEGSFGKIRTDQETYAGTLGYRFASREEHLVYAEDLLAKERAATINEAERKALETYRKRYVRDSEGGLEMDGYRIRARNNYWVDDALPIDGALFVRPSAESK